MPWSPWTVIEGELESEIDFESTTSILNTLGKLGWELVGPPEISRHAIAHRVFNQASGRPDIELDGTWVTGYMYFFKRRLAQ